MILDVRQFLEGLYGIQERKTLPPEWVDEYEERAAILEFDGGLARADAEKQASQEIMSRIENNKVI